MAFIGLDATSISIYGKGLSCYQYNLIHSLAKLDKNNFYYIFLIKIIRSRSSSRIIFIM